MSRILILANNDIGLYKFRKEVILELLKSNEVYVSLPYGDYIQKLKNIGCVYINTEFGRRSTNIIKDFILVLKYIYLFHKIRPELVLAYTIKPNIYGGIVCRLLNVPYIVNITGLGTAVENKGVLQYIVLKMYKLALKNAKCVFFQNKENMQFFKQKRVYDNNCVLLPGSGVNLNQYRVLDYPNDDKINFVFIGRIMKEKGIDQYLEAASYIRTKYDNVYFHIIGFCEEAYEQKLIDMHDKGIVLYHGMQQNIIKFHKMSHCTIHPTYYPEGMSNVLLESAACGRPVITTNRSGCREIVYDGISGYLVKEKNSQDLIDKIEKFLKLNNSERKKMGLVGREITENKYDRQFVIEQYLKEIDLLVRHRF